MDRLQARVGRAFLPARVHRHSSGRISEGSIRKKNRPLLSFAPLALRKGQQPSRPYSHVAFFGPESFRST